MVVFNGFMSKGWTLINESILEMLFFQTHKKRNLEMPKISEQLYRRPEKVFLHLSIFSRLAAELMARTICVFIS